MVLHLLVRLIPVQNGARYHENEPIYVCFKKYCLPLRFGDQGDASVVFLERLSRGIDAFLAECRRR